MCCGATVGHHPACPVGRRRRELEVVDQVPGDVAADLRDRLDRARRAAAEAEARAHRAEVECRRLRRLLAVLLGASGTPVPCQDPPTPGRVAHLALVPPEC